MAGGPFPAKPPGALLPRRGEGLLPLLSALLLVLSFPPLHLPVLPFVALTPFALFLHARVAEGSGGGRA
nr:hypothetical protein [Gemmatimonadota bacterium]NIR78652.1 hypothetical protein [Gemmatimonadota bacterium]NIT87271.1 hypothetical protein [Gemmatimonadota bacterium]NIU31115.1 hypothetical protein [Gemmatimonadota bacterium]NIU35849.1 hypothetical protein [Gemmatimonadota bacterium]